MIGHTAALGILLIGVALGYLGRCELFRDRGARRREKHGP